MIFCDNCSRLFSRGVPTPDLLDEVAAIKRRIERDIVGHEDRDRNVKLGAGGIREIEFVVAGAAIVARGPASFFAGSRDLEGAPRFGRTGVFA